VEARANELGTQLEAANAELTSLRAEKEQLTTNLQAVTVERDEARTQLEERTNEATSLREENTTLKANEATFTTRVNDEAQRLLAASGHRPLRINAEDEPGKEKTKGGLKGRERLSAAIKSQLTK